MAIEIKCTNVNCSATLSVGDEHAGKSARCPKCSTVVPIPSSANAGTTDMDPPGAKPPQANPFPAEPSEPQANPHSSSIVPNALSNLPHRGGLVLGLSIGGIICCPILSIVAIVFANEDLRKMDQGSMDPEGRGLTSAGKIVSIIGLILAGLGIVFKAAAVFVAGAGM